MQEFSISETGIKEIQKQALLKTLPITIIALGVGIAISQANSNSNYDARFIGLLGLFFAGMLTLSFVNAKKRIQSIYSNYKIIIGDNFIKREQGITLSLTLPQSEITEILKNKNGSITVKTTNSASFIGIPAQINNYSELQAHLARFRPITEKSTQTPFERFGFLLVFAMLGLMATVFIADNKVAVGLSGISVAGFMIWSFFQTIKNNSIDNKTKRTSYWLILVVFSVIGITILKLLK